MRAAPQDMGYGRAGQVHFDQRPRHCARRHQHSLRLPDFGASNFYGPSVEDDDEKQGCHYCDFQLRDFVSLLLRST